jgi:hypothetical protein
MTHDELITKLNTAYIMRDVDDIYNMHRALRAVVELHKPEPYDYNEELHFSCSCNQNVLGFLNPYPCPTIQAIEKELS